MRDRSGQSLLGRLAAHSAMGATLGLFLAVALMLSNERHIFDMLANGQDPGLSTAVFLATFVLIPAVGASLSGLIFILLDDR